MAYVRRHWVDYPDTTTPISADSLNNLEDGVEECHNIKLLDVTSTAPSECVEGDKYFDTTTNLIYTATGTNTWGDTGETPIENIFYIVLAKQATYTYDGTTLIGVGVPSIVNEYNTSETVSYSANYINELTADTGWLPLPLASGISAQSASSAYTPQYRKIGNIVYIEGCVKGATANNTVLATLPVGFRPVHTMRYMTGRSGEANAVMGLSTNGELVVINFAGGAAISASSYIYIQTSFLAN